MNCEDFLMQFREALDGRVAEQVIQENIQFYRSYIDNQIRGGKSEAQVLGSLGDPRLLAKTIEESSKFAAENGYSYESRQDGGFGNRGSYASPQGGTAYQDAPDGKRRFRLPGWLLAVLVVVLVVLVLSVVFRAFVFFMPLIAVVALAGLVYRLVRNWFGGT